MTPLFLESVLVSVIRLPVLFSSKYNTTISGPYQLASINTFHPAMSKAKEKTVARINTLLEL
jgi:hypothetical protein